MSQPPVGAARIAFSYLGSLLAGLVAALLAVMVSPLAASACRTTDDVACLLGWSYGSAILAFAVALGGVAWVLRLGWEWWAVLGGLLLGAPWWADALPMPAGVAVGLLGPALAGAATITGPQRPAWRPWAVAAWAVGLAGVSAAAIFTP